MEIKVTHMPKDLDPPIIPSIIQALAVRMQRSRLSRILGSLHPLDPEVCIMSIHKQGQSERELGQ